MQNVGNAEIKVSCLLGKFGNFIASELDILFSKDNLKAGLGVGGQEERRMVKPPQKSSSNAFFLVCFAVACRECVHAEREKRGQATGNTGSAAPQLGDTGCDISIFASEKWGK